MRSLFDRIESVVGNEWERITAVLIYREKLSLTWASPHNIGNDEEDDTPKAPVKTVDKNTMRSTKRSVEPQAPSKPVGNTGAGSRRAGPGGNEGG